MLGASPFFLHDARMTARDIRDTRVRLRLTQPQLGRLLGAHWVTVSKWEREEASPSEFQSELLRAFQRAARSPASFAAARTLDSRGVVPALRLLLAAPRAPRATGKPTS